MPIQNTPEDIWYEWSWMVNWNKKTGKSTLNSRKWEYSTNNERCLLRFNSYISLPQSHYFSYTDLLIVARQRWHTPASESSYRLLPLCRGLLPDYLQACSFISFKCLVKRSASRRFSDGSVVRNPPVNAGAEFDPGLERPHMLRATKPMSPGYWACALQPASTTTEACA